MPQNLKDETGNKYGRLTVIGRAKMPKHLSHNSERSYAYWYCECECGGNKVIKGDSLRNAGTKSCGCLVADVRRARPDFKEGVSVVKRKKPYQAWVTINYEKKYLGAHDTREEAQAAYWRAVDEMKQEKLNARIAD